MPVEILLAAAVAFGLALALVKIHPEPTKKWFRRIMRFRAIIGAIVGVVVALLLIGTGSTFLVLAGFIGLVYASLYLLFEEPHGAVLSWIGR